MDINKITEIIIGCAIEVHRQLGPGLLESAYEECLCYELAKTGAGCLQRDKAGLWIPDSYAQGIEI